MPRGYLILDMRRCLGMAIAALTLALGFAVPPTPAYADHGGPYVELQFTATVGAILADSGAHRVATVQARDVSTEHEIQITNVEVTGQGSANGDCSGHLFASDPTGAISIAVPTGTAETPGAWTDVSDLMLTVGTGGTVLPGCVASGAVITVTLAEQA